MTPIYPVNPKLFARILDYMEFSKVIRIVDKYEFGRFRILPYVSTVYTAEATINPHNLTKCSRVKTLILPNCNMLNNDILMRLPYLESLTMKSGSLITPEIFQYMSNLSILQILSSNRFEVNALITDYSLKYLVDLRCLHVSNPVVSLESLSYLKKLEVLIIENTALTPEILNYLPNLTMCIVNRTLIKYKSSIRNKDILKKIEKINHINIYDID